VDGISIGPLRKGFVGMDKHSHIPTFSGGRFDIIDPQTWMVNIQDMAQGLSNLCRFNGQTSTFYSVAEHSVIVHDLLKSKHGKGDISYAGLWHDGHEAYTGDVSKHLKALLPEYRKIENRVAAVVRSALDITWDSDIAREVKWADNIAARAEGDFLMKMDGQDWDWGGADLVPVPIVPYVPHAARTLFLHTYEE